MFAPLMRLLSTYFHNYSSNLYADRHTTAAGLLLKAVSSQPASVFGLSSAPWMRLALAA